MRRQAIFLLACSVLLVHTLYGTALAADETSVDFARDVRPILSKNCFQCHGPDESAREAELRLDLAEAAYESGALVPGQPEESTLLERIISDDPDLHMPPADSKKVLTAREIELLRQWVADGARYERHWAFVPPRRPPVPEVSDAGWARNPIDQFVLARLTKEGLQPSPPADRYTLVRRLYLDLIGLPPSPEVADAFVADTRPDAYERLVDRLLASPHYGERWARQWLDLARYADTNGYEKDQRRTMWPYRNWVIDSLNAGMPFDQFTIEQIAGDMLPDATISKNIATGFHRNTMINEEGGVDPMEYRFYAQVDRVATTGTVWLGLTINCTQCHDHKYDPLLQREFYELMAFYDQADDRERELPDEAIARQRAEFEAKIAAIEADLANRFPVEEAAGESVEAGRREQLQRSFAKWIERESKRIANWTLLEPKNLESTLPILTVLDDRSVLSSGDVQKSETFHATCHSEAATITAIRLEMLPHDSLPNGGPGRGSIAASIEQKGRFILNDFSLTVDGRPVSLEEVSHSYAHKTNVAANAIDADPQSGWANNGMQGRRVTAVFQLAQPLAVTPENELKFMLHSEAFYPSGVGRFRLSFTSDAMPVVANGFPVQIEAMLAKADAERSASETQRLLDYYLSVAPELEEEHKKIAELRQQMPRFTRGLVLQQRQSEHHRQTVRHHRGEFLQPRESVQPGVFDALHDFPEELPRDRATLARWLVAGENPLVARVTVNRDWAALFGQGLVRTTEDFGTQGELPTHPRLLDWLAVEFMESGWSRKQLHRLIVTSATYRQASWVTDELFEHDPSGALLGRGSRFRVDAELVRDIALSVGGLLSEKIGGPSVFPPQPAGVSEDAYGPLSWKVSTGEDRYRRGLYTFSKRTAPYAMFNVFDSPSGEVCVARRDRSNTPLQALTMLNDAVVMEAARKLATLAVKSADGTPASSARAIFRRCVVRPPQPDEIEQIVNFYHRQLARFQNGELDAAALTSVNETPNKDDSEDEATSTAADGEAAAKVAEINELAAWTAVARAVLNLDETITKD